MENNKNTPSAEGLRNIVSAEHNISHLWTLIDPAAVPHGLLDAIHAAETATAALRVAWKVSQR